LNARTIEVKASHLSLISHPGWLFSPSRRPPRGSASEVACPGRHGIQPPQSLLVGMPAQRPRMKHPANWRLPDGELRLASGLWTNFSARTRPGRTATARSGHHAGPKICTAFAASFIGLMRVGRTTGDLSS
jgi:hypothetical protein